GCAVDVFGSGDRDRALRERAQRGGPAAAFQERALAEDRPGAELREDVPIHVDLQDTVEQQVELVAFLPLLGKNLARLHLALLRLLAGAHDQERKLALERALDRSDDRRRILGTPRRSLAEGVLRPVLEVDQTALRCELAL